MVEPKLLVEIVLKHWETDDSDAVSALVAELESFINDYTQDQIWHATIED